MHTLYVIKDTTKSKHLWHVWRNLQLSRYEYITRATERILIGGGGGGVKDKN